MKNLLLTAILVIGIVTAARTQNPEVMKKMEAAKIGVITERLELTTEQAEKFWPVYHEFNKKRRAILEEMRSARKTFDPETATEEESKKMMDLNFDVKERELKLEKEYSEKFLKVISTRQLVSLRQAEDDFRHMVLEQLERRARQPHLRENPQEKRPDRNNGNRPPAAPGRDLMEDNAGQL